MGRWLSLAQAAAAQGVGPDAIRKRIPTGQVRARKRAGRWQVWVSAADLDIRIVPDCPDAPDPPTPDVPDIPDAPDRPDYQEPPQPASLAQRAEEMAVYSERLLAPYVAQIAAQAEEIGALKAQLAAATHLGEMPEVASTPNAENGHARTQNAPLAEWPTGRRVWWKRLVWG